MTTPFPRPTTRRWVGLSICCLFLLSFFPVRAQVRNFSPETEDEAYLTSLSDKYLQRYKDNLGKLPARNKKDLTEAYQVRWENIKEKFDKKEIYTSKQAQAYLDRLTAAIKSANPSLANVELSCYFSRSDVPNASYIGEGIILFNMGLFHRLDNESEVVFILCHEIAHYVLHHSENSILQYVATLNSDEVQAQLRKIQRSEYHKHDQVQDLVKGLTFDSRRHSRDHEAQADSMAAELMRHTRFSLSGALSTLALLDVIDADTLNTAVCLPATFHAAEYPFKKKWLKNETLLGAHTMTRDTVMADSLKTHPDCQKRIGWLSKMMSGWSQPAGSRFVVDSSTFVLLRTKFQFETIEYAYSARNYTKSLFLTLDLLQRNPSDAWLVTQTGRVLSGLYAAQKSHTLSKVVDLPSPDYPSNYNLLLQFVQNLYLEDIASISYYFLRKYHTQLDSYSPYRTACEESERLMKN